MVNLENFVEQVHEVEYLNLFVSSLTYVLLIKRGRGRGPVRELI